jgi:hypothetical protein
VNDGVLSAVHDIQGLGSASKGTQDNRTVELRRKIETHGKLRKATRTKVQGRG